MARTKINQENNRFVIDSSGRRTDEEINWEVRREILKGKVMDCTTYMKGKEGYRLTRGFHLLYKSEKDSDYD